MRALTATGALSLFLLAAGAFPAYGNEAPGATPLAPVSPTPGFSAVEHSPVSFSWSGNLEGEASTLNRSQFKLEVGPASSPPASQNAAWTDATVTLLTPPGNENVKTLTAPMPAHGSYVWRVCAWGTSSESDPNGNDPLVILDCTPLRALTATPAVNAQKPTGLITMTHTTATPAKPKVKTIYRKATIVSPPAKKKPATKGASAPPARPTFDTGQLLSLADEATSSNPHSTKVTPAAHDDDAVASALGGGAGAHAASVLGWQPPGIPIPFWTLLLIIAAVPLSLWWRGMLPRMFQPYKVGPDGEPVIEDNADESDDDAADGRNESTEIDNIRVKSGIGDADAA